MSDDDYQFHRNKRPDKTYVSRRLSSAPDSPRPFRIASKVFDRLYRRSTLRPEIITFDELLHRAKFVLEHAEA